MGLAAELRALLRSVPAPGPELQRAILDGRRPTALLAQGAAVAGRMGAMIDLSDGLAQNTAHRASGARLVLVCEHVFHT